jgi:hypothetical protein
VASFADVLPPAGIATVVMLIAVEDRAAIEYDVALFQALVSGASVRTAHETGIEAIARFGGMIQAPMLIPADKVNGDFAKLRDSVPAIGAALAANDMTTAHALIADAMRALERLDTRIVGIEASVSRHETRLTAIERHIHPAPLVNALRVVAFFVVLLGIALAGFQYPVFSLYPFLGLIVEGALIVLAGVILLYANAIQERHQ